MREDPEHRTRHPWVPHEYGAWAMLAVPLMLGVAPSAPDLAQLVLAVSAVSGYLLLAAAQGWLRPRTRDAYRVPLASYAAVFTISAGGLAITHPYLLVTLPVIGPAAALTLVATRAGVRRDLAVSLAEVAMAVTLVPAAASLGSHPDPATAVRATVVAALYLGGVVLVVRSVIRERSNRAFAALSVAYHGLALVIVAAVLPPAYALLGLLLAVRAAGLPVLQRRWAGRRQVRPIQVGVVEIAASASLVVLAFVAPL